MKRLDAQASASPAVHSDSVTRRRKDNLNSIEKKANRKSLEFPQRKIFDAQCVLDKVKKSYSFDQNCDGDIVAKIVEDRFAGAIARKVQLANEKSEQCNKPRVKLTDDRPEADERPVCSVPNDKFDDSENRRKPSRFGIKLLSDYLKREDTPRAGKLANPAEAGAKPCPASDGASVREKALVQLRESAKSSAAKDARGARCRSTPPWGGPWPPPWAAEGTGGRLCRTWYGGYGTLTEDEDTPQRNLTDKAGALSTVAGAGGCGAGAGAGHDAAAGAVCAEGRRRADGRRRGRTREPPPMQPSLGSSRLSASTLSLNLLPRLSAAVIPLRRGGLARSAATLLEDGPLLPPGPPLRKCETMAALGGAEPQRPVNRLRAERVCSRCSSLLSLAGGGSRYSLAAGGFVPAPDPMASPPLSSTPPVSPPPASTSRPAEPALLCKLCLEDVPRPQVTIIKHCGCSFCTRCMQAYTEYEIMNGAYDISCPDSKCSQHGVMAQVEVEALVSSELVDKYRKFRLNHEVAMDGGRAFCPRVGCETVCRVSGCGGGGPVGSAPPQPVRCPTCDHHFCSACTNQWHAGMDCGAYSRQLALEAAEGLPAESDLIKWCPMCLVPIEKDEGCAQMMCKRCKHVFCWYCLASLDDDFLLRHYDKGPCKNKLGHSRASVIWHRAQVVGIFAGFGLLLLVASPLLLLAAPCIVCCKCRLCNSNGGKTIDGDDHQGMDIDPEDAAGDEIQKINGPVLD